MALYVWAKTFKEELKAEEGVGKVKTVRMEDECQEPG